MTAPPSDIVFGPLPISNIYYNPNIWFSESKQINFTSQDTPFTIQKNEATTLYMGKTYYMYAFVENKSANPSAKVNVAFFVIDPSTNPLISNPDYYTGFVATPIGIGANGFILASSAGSSLERSAYVPEKTGDHCLVAVISYEGIDKWTDASGKGLPNVGPPDLRDPFIVQHNIMIDGVEQGLTVDTGTIYVNPINYSPPAGGDPSSIILRNPDLAELEILRQVGDPALNNARILERNESLEVGLRFKSTGDSSTFRKEEENAEDLPREMCLPNLEPGCKGTFEVVVKVPKIERTERSVSFILAEQIKDKDRSVIGGVVVAVVN